MTVPPELETAELAETSNSSSDLPVAFDLEGELEKPIDPSDDDYMNDVEMGLFDHLEELRLRIFYALVAVGVGIVGCFTQVKPLVKLLQQPAQGVKFLQLAPGEFFFVSLKVAGYSGMVLAAPFILYQIIAFVTPGLTRKEKRILGPVVLGSGVLFLGGLAFAYVALIPAALNFFISYGEDVVEQSWSIERYFELILLLMFSTGIAFQVPIVQTILGVLGIVSSRQMISGWRYVLVGAAIAGAILTPSTDPLTQSLLAGAVLGLYFSGIGIVKLLGK
jgi:sec-independent protein translocase protein TatC